MELDFPDAFQRNFYVRKDRVDKLNFLRQQTKVYDRQMVKSRKHMKSFTGKNTLYYSSRNTESVCLPDELYIRKEHKPQKKGWNQFKWDFTF